MKIYSRDQVGLSEYVYLSLKGRVGLEQLIFKADACCDPETNKGRIWILMDMLADRGNKAFE